MPGAKRPSPQEPPGEKNASARSAPASWKPVQSLLMGKSPARLKSAQAIGPACSSGYIRSRSKFKGVKRRFAQYPPDILLRIKKLNKACACSSSPSTPPLLSAWGRQPKPRLCAHERAARKQPRQAAKHQNQANYHAGKAISEPRRGGRLSGHGCLRHALPSCPAPSAAVSRPVFSRFPAACGAHARAAIP